MDYVVVQDRIPVLVDRVTTLCGPGELINVVATERGIAINPKRQDLMEAALGCTVPIRPIEEIADEVNRLTGGPPEKPKLGVKVVAAITWVDGTNYFLIWANGYDLRATRVTPGDGTVLDPPDDFNMLPGGIEVCLHGEPERAQLATDGSDAVLLWYDDTIGSTRRSRIDTSDGTLLDSSSGECGPVFFTGNWTDFTVAGGQQGLVVGTELIRYSLPDFAPMDPDPVPFVWGMNHERSAAVASNGEDFLVAWVDGREPQWDVYAARVRGSDGAPLDPAATRLTATDEKPHYVSVASNGTDYMVVWQEKVGFRPQVRGARVRASDGANLDGPPEDGGIVITDDTSSIDCISEPRVASDGNSYLVAWLRQPPQYASDVWLFGTRYDADGNVLESYGGHELIEIFHEYDDAEAENLTLGCDRHPDPAMRTYLAVWRYRSESSSGMMQPWHLRAARVRAALGRAIDSYGGIEVNTPDERPSHPAVSAAGSEFLIAWQQDGSSYQNKDLWAGRMDVIDGTFLDGTGMPVSTTPFYEGYPSGA